MESIQCARRLRSDISSLVVYGAPEFYIVKGPGSFSADWAPRSTSTTAGLTIFRFKCGRRTKGLLLSTRFFLGGKTVQRRIYTSRWFSNPPTTTSRFPPPDGKGNLSLIWRFPLLPRLRFCRRRRCCCALPSANLVGAPQGDVNLRRRFDGTPPISWKRI